MHNYHGLLLAHNDHIANTTGHRPSFFIRTYGCQMNSRDSEKLAALLTQLGYQEAQSLETSDLALFNTCCVRESAENRIFGHLSRLRHTKETQKPDMLIAVGGCMSQQAEISEKIAAAHPYINVVFGTANRHRLPQFLWQAIQSGKQVIDISEDENLPELDSVPVTTRDYAHKAGVNIMYGCDNYCSYCIVPYVRGRERSRPAADILREIEALAADGVKEIMLLGQNVNSYGKRLANDSLDSGVILDFPTLLRHVNQVPGLERIRFMTSHPKDFSNDLVAAVRDLDKVCKSVHLPLQSGSTRVLEDMNRQYTQDDYLALAARLQQAGIGLSTDIIVGYPGETEDDFIATLEVARKVRFLGAFTFIYSKRSGTPAAKRTDLVPRKVSSERFERLTATIYPILLEINQAKVGSTVHTMVEETSGTAIKGRTDDNTLVHFDAEQGAYKLGQIVPVRITSAKSFYVCGEIV
ncbi:MAG: tRNA (N6-isopentenyl adenosine(37)-C2)-methylthiotransferase MiaB [Defluviitaleaceae bacterium]|nr:tRNA (N6-isopentenyl adenosine(37)-C2)-methylthiotransferase MiaB [Defluviitaleaceae bacterium]